MQACGTGIGIAGFIGPDGLLAFPKAHGTKDHERLVHLGGVLAIGNVDVMLVPPNGHAKPWLVLFNARACQLIFGQRGRPIAALRGRLGATLRPKASRLDRLLKTTVISVSASHTGKGGGVRSPRPMLGVAHAPPSPWMMQSRQRRRRKWSLGGVTTSSVLTPLEKTAEKLMPPDLVT